MLKFLVREKRRPTQHSANGQSHTYRNP